MSTHPDPEQLSAYVDGELTGTDRDDLEQHLTGCSQCSATLRSLRATLADMRALPSPAPSEQESWALRAAITKARRKPAERYRRWVIAASGVAAVAVAVVVISTTGTSTKKPEASSSPASFRTSYSNRRSDSRRRGESRRGRRGRMRSVRAPRLQRVRVIGA